MSNTKDVTIEAELPFDWTQHLTCEEAQLFCRSLLRDSGLSLEYVGGERLVPNSHGGRTTMLNVRITGVEAVPVPALRLMVAALARQEFARIRSASYVDMDDPQDRTTSLMPPGPARPVRARRVDAAVGGQEGKAYEAAVPWGWE
jgi:hypothetical protein